MRPRACSGTTSSWAAAATPSVPVGGVSDGSSGFASGSGRVNMGPPCALPMLRRARPILPSGKSLLQRYQIRLVLDVHARKQIEDAELDCKKLLDERNELGRAGLGVSAGQ